MFEIRFHGRGGQGTVTASRILALAAFEEGKYVISFPFFGTERRGAPVTAFTRIDDQPILLKTQIYNPNIVVVLDPWVLDNGDAASGISQDGMFIINTRKKPEDFDLERKTFTVDATSIAVSLELGTKANPIVNTAILGAFAKATGLVSLETVVHATMESSPNKKQENADAVRQAYISVRIG
ncbi:MAG: 2-oxoacid:acceptor oxidoreductase family protein [Candidatus Thermoplasmatota archaeon]|jgi:2-oxoacid:acceptor oxidoreductase gamma subunit (pyruvate/2-ketoisovalerate family)|nr:2-oxoacid:acceptor oxidoreductase family protein [Candidatus Thermoplasmatota archaeon]MCL5954507.1 2-oxoacid:acceptor oxidoreductase family protein [Candidatus Thermoplasmatota archaeon]